RARRRVFRHGGSRQAAQVPVPVSDRRARGAEQDRPVAPRRLLARRIPRELESGEPTRRHAPRLSQARRRPRTMVRLAPRKRRVGTTKGGQRLVNDADPNQPAWLPEDGILDEEGLAAAHGFLEQLSNGLFPDGLVTTELMTWSDVLLASTDEQADERSI